MTAQRKYTFPDGKRLTLGEKTLVMGILNITPDSFSDGGKFNTRDKALRHLEEMAADGADIIDVGAESSRPGFTPMPASEEIERLMPLLEEILKNSPVPVSVDTFKAETARAAAKAGVHILNDIWGLQYAAEPGAMAKVAAEFGLPVVVMHNQQGTEYSGDIIDSMQG
ncbi:MAG: dihydropteroate synthase, partial [Selenomonas sp.]|nr:dihydropteroate synthase [Selenomonas sp.]